MAGGTQYASKKKSGIPISPSNARGFETTDKSAYDLNSKRLSPTNRDNKPVIKGGTAIDKSARDGFYETKLRARSNNKGLTFDPYKIYNFGEAGSGFNLLEHVQDYYKLRAMHLKKKTLFNDPQFPCNNDSIYGSSKPRRTYEWKRPGEIIQNPRFLAGEFSRFDIVQGDLGDCWLLAATANLTLFKRLFFQVVPEEQSYLSDYAGIFHFRFWQYGRWVDLVVDDRLPTYKGELVYMHSMRDNAFWSALLEKAYAKLHGSYDALKGGTTNEAMEDFTGGVTEMMELSPAPIDWFTIMKKAYDRCSLLSCSIEPEADTPECRTPQGLVKGHAYSITDIKHVNLKQGAIRLIRVRNPWGDDVEWNGAWSDRSPEWKYISDEEKQRLGITFSYDGEFWMSSHDFVKYFTRVEICNLNPNIFSGEIRENSVNKNWEVTFYEGEWVKNVTAGGCRNFLETFASNPQYRITVQADDDDTSHCTLIVGLVQKNRRRNRVMGLDVMTIGFVIYHLDSPNKLPKPLDKMFFKSHKSCAKSPSFVNVREIACRFKLAPGVYCIVPSTYEPNQEAQFLLRVFSEKSNELQEFDEDVSFCKAFKGKTQAGRRASEDESSRLYSSFKIIAGKDEEINWEQLKSLIDQTMENTKLYKGFSKDVCRSLVATIDKLQTGKFGIAQFKLLWADIQEWRDIFFAFDVDKNAILDGFELREAFKSMGYKLNNHTLNILMRRYGDSTRGGMEFDDFLMCSIKLKTMIEIFQSKAAGTQDANFSLIEWIDYTLYS